MSWETYRDEQGREFYRVPVRFFPQDCVQAPDAGGTPESHKPANIVDAIDALVDEQLQQEASGYDHNINQAKCWHCGRDWHGLPVTKRIAEMYAQRTYDGTYSLAGDDSPVLCEGSDFIGPVREQPVFGPPGWLLAMEFPGGMVERHPDHGPLRRTGPNPWGYRFDPQEGDRISYQVGDRLVTGVVTRVNNEGRDVRVTIDPEEQA